MLSRIVSLLLVLLLTACGQKELAPTWQEQYDLGVRYLSEGNYEEAIIAFNAAIEIDPKQEDAYKKAAEAYIAMNNLETAIEVLQQGLDLTNSESLKELLDRLSVESKVESEASIENETDTFSQTEGEKYEFQTLIPADVYAENLIVCIHDSRTATVTVEGLSLQDSYLTNLASSYQNALEYSWSVTIYGSVWKYQVSTTCWAFEPGAETTMAISDMQHSVWYYDGEGASWIAEATMSHTSESITWTFTIPEEYPFDFEQATQYEVSIYDISTYDGNPLQRIYTSE